MRGDFVLNSFCHIRNGVRCFGPSLYLGPLTGISSLEAVEDAKLGGAVRAARRCTGPVAALHLMQAPRLTPSSGRDTPWSSTAHGKTPALPRCPAPQPPRSTLGSCAPRHSGDPWGTPGALEHPAATAGACAAAWARVGPRLCWAGRGAACWCYTAGAASGCPAPPLCSVRSPPPWGARFGVLPGCPRAPEGSCARRGVGRASCSGAMCGVRRGTAPSVPAAKAGAGWRRRAREWAPPQFQPQTIARSSWNDVSPPGRPGGPR